MQKLRYRINLLASFLPLPVLRFLGRHWRLGEDEADGWNFWIDADYHKYCRIDKRLNGTPACMSCGGNDGYGPPPHHTPDCYFAGWDD